MSSSALTELTSLLSQGQLSKLQQLVAELSPTQQAWVSGYLAATSQHAGGSVPVSSSNSEAAITVLYGSQTGNAKTLAEELAESLQQQGLTVNLVSMGQYKPQQLKKEQYLLLLTSTHGEGEPPEDAETLHKFLVGNKAPKLNHLKYSVLSLGDSSYEFFCQTGKDFDERLQKLGAESFEARVDCDLDYEDAATAWFERVAEWLKTNVAVTSASSHVSDAQSVGTSQYSRKNPFAATLLTNQKITGRRSGKDVRHVELSLEDSGIHYQPGDALGVWFSNDAELVDEILSLSGIAPDEAIEFDGQSQSIRDVLVNYLEITQLTPKFVADYAKLIESPELQHFVEDKDALREYVNNHQLVQLISQFPGQISAEQLVSSLRKITPRLYSIASSQAEIEDEVHLTVGVVNYDDEGKTRFGGASGFLANRLEEGATVNVYVEENHNFKLPEDNNKPVIMIGPGTGIAPFRAFLQQRDNEGAEGDNWLFFGNPKFLHDFHYQTELLDYLDKGVLNRLDVAFSRDQAEKIYVQDRMVENAQALFQWLEQGACLYVCGDANRMAKDVHQTLLTIIEQEGGYTSTEAEQYLENLRTTKRYQKDVY